MLGTSGWAWNIHRLIISAVAKVVLVALTVPELSQRMRLES